MFFFQIYGYLGCAFDHRIVWLDASICVANSRIGLRRDGWVQQIQEMNSIDEAQIRSRLEGWTSFLRFLPTNLIISKCFYFKIFTEKYLSRYSRLSVYFLWFVLNISKDLSNFEKLSRKSIFLFLSTTNPQTQSFSVTVGVMTRSICTRFFCPIRSSINPPLICRITRAAIYWNPKKCSKMREC